MIFVRNLRHASVIRIRPFKPRSFPRQTFRANLPLQQFCSSPEPQFEDSPVRTFCIFINKNIDEAPIGMMLGFILSRMCLWFTLQRVLLATNFLCGPELAVGYMVARVTGKFRQPMNIAMAVGLSKLFPVFQLLNISKLLGLDQDKLNRGPKKTLTEEEIYDIKQQLLGLGVEKREIDMFEFQHTKLNSVEGGLTSLNQWLAAPLNNYGLSFFLSMRATNWATILLVSTMINQGVDVLAFIESWGMSKEIGENFGALAGACLINAPLFPLHMYIATQIAPAIEQHAHFIQQPQQEEKHPWEVYLEETMRKNDFKRETKAPKRSFTNRPDDRPPKS